MLATGKRRFVVCQQIAEAKRFSGDLEGALNTIEQVGEPGAEALDRLPPMIHEKLISLTPDPLTRWDSITLEIASIGLGLTLAGVLLELARTADAHSAFKAMEARLESVTGEDGARLWLRWGRDYAWFLSELLGQPQAADDECRRIRQRVDVADPALEAERLSLLYAESHAAIGRAATIDWKRFSMSASNWRRR